MRRPWERRRRWLRWGLVGGLGFLIVGCLGLYLAYPRIAAWKIRDKATAALESRLGRDVTIGQVDVDRDGLAVLSDISIAGPADRGEPLIEIDRVRVHYDFWASVTGTVKIREVELDGLHVRAVRAADGSDNFGDLLDRFTGGDDTAAQVGAASRTGMRPRRLEVTSGDVRLRDESTGATAAVGALSVVVEDGGALELVLGEIDADSSVGPSAAAGRVVITADAADVRGTAEATVEGGRASLWPGMSLTGIAGSLTEGDRPGVLVVDLSGGYGGAEGTLWTAGGWLDPRTRTGELEMTADRFTLDRISQVLEGTVVKDYEETEVDAKFTARVARGRAEVDGNFRVSGLTISHPMLASKPVQDLEMSGPLRVVYDRKDRRVELTNAELTSRGVVYQVSAFADLPTGESQPHWHVGGRLTIPELPCQKMLEGIPKELVPYLEGAELGGTFYTDLKVDIDFADLEATTLDGGVGIRGCKVKEMPEDSNADRLREPFLHYVEVQRDKWIAFEVGPDNPDFVPLEEVSPYVINSFMTTEDSRFYKHRGFIVPEFTSALIRNLESGYFKFGASSITMQMVKNVMLYREKTLSRKLQELFFTWYLETELEKDRIMEIYVNAIEYGPGLYGLKPAAQRYFGKHPQDLNPVEAAFFSSILPNPKYRYKQYCANKLWRRTENKIQRILGHMLDRKRLSEEEYAIALITPLVFDRDIEAESQWECTKKVKEAIENARPTNPMKK